MNLESTTSRTGLKILVTLNSPRKSKISVVSTTSRTGLEVPDMVNMKSALQTTTNKKQQQIQQIKTINQNSRKHQIKTTHQ